MVGRRTNSSRPDIQKNPRSIKVALSIGTESFGKKTFKSRKAYFFSNSIPPSVINNLPSFQVTNPHAFHDTYSGNENGRAKNYIVRKDHNTSQVVKLIGNEQIESVSIGSCNDINIGLGMILL